MINIWNIGNNYYSSTKLKLKRVFCIFKDLNSYYTNADEDICNFFLNQQEHMFQKGCLYLDEIQCEEEKILKFEMENSEFLSNNLVVSFLKIPTNKEIYLETICNPTPENMKKLDNLFKNFYFRIRFISHISTTLKFNSINYDKKTRLIQSRYTPTLDASINPSGGGEETFVDLIADENAEELLDKFNKSLNEHITCPIIYDAFDNLTYKQKEIINLAYVEGLSDTEIGLVLNVTQQAVSKMHKKALTNMQNYIERQNNEIDASKKGG